MKKGFAGSAVVHRRRSRCSITPSSDAGEEAIADGSGRALLLPVQLSAVDLTLQLQLPLIVGCYLARPRDCLDAAWTR